MTEFGSQDISTELWEEILKQHWNYFATEESMIKLENRKKLEDCLKEFLCIIQHDRKFLLPETLKILKKSVQDLDDFSAQKAITAFDSISQYADNLYTKPWRKEFRILKMYSGFYQHEIKSNLLNAQLLFEAMGYRRLSDDTLILDGPICPDQVANVSRDALTAYVELKIIKHIYAGLHAIGVNGSWLDIYRYREKYTGGTTQAVKAIAYSIEEKRFQSIQKPLVADNYGYLDVQPPYNYFTNNTQFCQCRCNLLQKASPMCRHQPIALPPGICCVPMLHQELSKTTTNLVYSNMAYPAHYQHNNHPLMSSDSGDGPLPQMSHSRSLEHYSEQAGSQHNILPTRHSFDHQQQGCNSHQYHNSLQLQQQQQQQHYYQRLNQPQQNFYESPYDCIDGNSLDSGGINPYNVSGNRYPLPLTISNQLSAYDNLQSSNYNGLQEPTYAHISDQHSCSSVSKLSQNRMINTNVGSYNHTVNGHGSQKPLLVKDSLERQRSCQSEHFINFEDPILPPSPPQQRHHPNYETSNHILDTHCNAFNALPITSNCQQTCVSSKPTINGMYAYPRENHTHNTYSSQKYSCNSRDRGDTTDISYESANDDLVNLTCQENERKQMGSPTQFTKNQDGIGSSERWDYVFQNLEHNACSKDLDEKKDLLDITLDLESLNINNDVLPNQSTLAEKRSEYSTNENKTTSQRQRLHQQLEPKQKNKTIENGKYKNNTICTTSSTNAIQTQTTSMDNNTRKIKSVFKQTNATSKTNTKMNPKDQPSKTQPKLNDNKTNPVNGTTQRKKSSSSVLSTKKKSTSAVSTKASPVPTQIIVTSANEWSCGYCTFLNPGTINICEMCYRTNGFNMNTSAPSTATGVTTVAQNAPTCA